MRNTKRQSKIIIKNDQSLTQTEKSFGVANYTIGDFLTRLKNASLAKKHSLEVANTKFTKAVAQTLKKEGYLDEVVEKGGKLFVRISFKKKEPLIFSIRLVSKPGLRVYMGADKLARIKGPSTFIISTNKGIMSLSEAIKKRIGGEVIAEVL